MWWNEQERKRVVFRIGSAFGRVVATITALLFIPGAYPRQPPRKAWRTSGVQSGTALGRSALSENTRTQLAEQRRKEIFLALVEAQDEGADVAESRKQVAQQFGVDEADVRAIEREGLDAGWPPL